MDKQQFNDLKNKVSFGCDWLNGHIDYDNVLKFFSKLRDISPKLDRFCWLRADTGIYNYSDRYLWHGLNGFQIAYNPLSDSDFFAQTKSNSSAAYGNYGIFITLSGSAMRELENLEPGKNCLSEFMYLVYKLGFNATRYDVFMDCFDKDILPMETIDYCFSTFYTPSVGSPALSTNFTRTCKDNCKVIRNVSCDDEVYYNYQLGGHGSRTGMTRIYNKFDEQRKKLSDEGFKELQAKYGFSDYWERFEFELHKDRANQAFQACMEAYESDKKSFNFSGLWLSSSVLFFTIVVPKAFGQRLGAQPKSDVWVSFITLITEFIHFVQLGGGVFSFPKLPYIRESIKRQLLNDERIMCRDFKKAIISRLRPDFIYHRIAFEKLKDSPKFLKWCEDLSVELNVDFVSVQLAALELSGN